MSKRLTWQFYRYPGMGTAPPLISPINKHQLTFCRAAWSKPKGAQRSAPLSGGVLGRELLMIGLFDLTVAPPGYADPAWSDEVWSSIDGMNWLFKESIGGQFATTTNAGSGLFASPTIGDGWIPDTGNLNRQSAPPAWAMADGSFIIPLLTNSNTNNAYGFLIRDSVGRYSAPLPTPPASIVAGGALWNQGKQLALLMPDGAAPWSMIGFLPHPDANYYEFSLMDSLGTTAYSLSVSTGGVFQVTKWDSVPSILNDFLNTSLQGYVNLSTLGLAACVVGDASSLSAIPSAQAITQNCRGFGYLPPTLPAYTVPQVAANGAGWVPADIGGELVVFNSNSPDANAVAYYAYGASIYGSGGWEVLATPPYAEIYNGVYYSPGSMVGQYQLNLSGHNVAPNGLNFRGRTWFFDPVGSDGNNDVYGSAAILTDPQVTGGIGFASTKNFVLSKRALAYYQRIGFLRLAQEYL